MPVERESSYVQYNQYQNTKTNHFHIGKKEKEKEKKEQLRRLS